MSKRELQRCWKLASAVVAGLVLAAAVRAEADAGLELRLALTTEAVASAPESPAPLLRRADLYRRSGDFAAAHADLDRAARIAPDLREIDYRRAELLLDEGVAAQAIAVLDRLLAAEPGHVGGHVARARALRRLGRPLEAAEAYTRALERTPAAPPDLYLDRAETLAASDPPDLTAAIAGLDEGIEALGPLPTLTQAAIDLLVRAGRTEEALARIEREIARSPQPVWWMVRKAELLADLGRGGPARSVYAEAWRHLLEQPAHRRSQPGWRKLEARLQRQWTRLSMMDVE